MLKSKTIKLDKHQSPISLNWRGNELIDWVAGGNIYTLDGEFKRSNRRFAYRFDSAIQSKDGVYAVIYEKNGTKGLILKNREILREINRSYYQAEAYEYPIAFLRLPSSEYAIVHCPNDYNQIEIETVEEGKILTKSENRKPDDCFHSRFRVSPSQTNLINSGWVWHPFDILQVYDIQKGLENNSIFDNSNSKFPINIEVCSADFLTDDLILISGGNDEPLDEDASTISYLNANEIGLFSIEQNKYLKKVRPEGLRGTLIPINPNTVLDLYEYPKLIDLNTGKILQKFHDIHTGKQVSSINSDIIPPIAFDRQNQRIAIGNEDKIVILSFN